MAKKILADVTVSGYVTANKGVILPGTSAPISLNGSTGTAGQVLTSNGSGTPLWSNAGSSAESTIYLVRNNTGSTILKGTLLAASGAEPSGRIDVEPFATTGLQDSELRVMGVAIANISNGVNGTVMSFGTLTGVDTRGDVASALAVGDETWAEGDILFAHPTVAGKLTKVRPQHDLAVAFITVRHASSGQIAIRIVPGNFHLEWLHDVDFTSKANNDLLQYESSTGLWKNRDLTTAGIAKLAGGNTFTGNQTFSNDITHNGYYQNFNNMLTSGRMTIGESSLASGINLFVRSTASTNVGLVVKGATSQSASLQEWKDSAGTVLSSMTSAGNLNVGQIRSGTTSGLAQITSIAGSASTIGAIIRGAASQTADLQQWQNSAGVANLKINSIGDINGTIVNGSYPITYNLMTGHNPEGKLQANPMLINDIAYARLRGSTFTFTGLTPSSGDIDSMFNASSSFWNVAAGSFPATQVIEFTSPVTLTYGAFFGISFGNSGWAVRDITLEAFSEGVWKTVATTTSNNSEVFMGAIPNNSGIGTTQFRITLATPLGAAVRITHIFAYNFASPLAKGIYLGRDGGTMFGDVYGAGKTMGFGFGRFGSDVNWTDSTALKATSTAAGNRALIVKGFASQTADLQQWQNSAGTVIADISADGALFINNQTTTSDSLLVQRAGSTHFRVDPFNNGFATGTFTVGANSTAGSIQAGIYSSSATNKGLIIRGAASQTGNLQEWQNSAGTSVARVEASGNFIISGIGVTSGDHRVGTSSYFSAALNVLARATTEKGLVVRGQASQTANHFETQDTSGTTRFYIDAAHNANFSSASWFQNSTGKLTIGLTSASAVGLTVKGATSQSADLMQWQDSSGTRQGFVGAGGNTITFPGVYATYNMTATAGAAAVVPMVVTAASGQSANLQEWRTSTPTTVTSISPTGVLTSTGLSLSSTTSPITLNGSVGTSGQVLTSAGAGATPTWTTISGSGTVTSVAMTVPTGLSISGSPITSSGTLALTLTSGYSIPTTSSQANWDTAYTDRNKWDGGSTGLNAATGRTSLGLGTMATQPSTSPSITTSIITPTTGTFDLLNTNATTINFGGAASTLNIGKVFPGSSVIVGNRLAVNSSLDVSGGNGSSGLSIFDGGDLLTDGVIGASGTITGGNLTSTGILTRTALATGGATTGASINASGQFIRTSSSARYKQDIEDANFIYEDVLALAPKTFRLKEEAQEDPESKIYGGLLAEDVDQLESLKVFVNYQTQDDGSVVPDGIAYGEMVAALVSAIKHQDARIKALEGIIENSK